MFSTQLISDEMQLENSPNKYVLFEWFFAYTICDWFSNQSIKNKRISNVMLKEIQHNEWKTLFIVGKSRQSN